MSYEKLRDLASISRRNGIEELKLELVEYTSLSGRKSRFVSCRVFARGHGGECVPTKQGVSIGLNELGPVLHALESVKREQDEPPRAQWHPQRGFIREERLLPSGPA